MSLQRALILAEPLLNLDAFDLMIEQDQLSTHNSKSQSCVDKFRDDSKLGSELRHKNIKLFSIPCKSLPRGARQRCRRAF